MNSRRFALFATDDGGGTWEQLPEPPGAGPLQFISPQQGWMIGGPEKPDGIPVPELENLWATLDGGVHWRVVKVPVPPLAVPDPYVRDPYLTEFRFRDSLHGLLVARRQISGYEFQVFTCATEDGGNSWRISSFDAYHASPSFVGGHIVWSVLVAYKQPLKIHSGDRVTSPALAGGVPLHGGLRDVSFFDDSNGWTVYDHDERSDVVATADGGETFRIISPEVVVQAPLPPPSIVAVNGRTTSTFAGPMSHVPPYAPAGGSVALMGGGFLSENTVRIGTRSLQVSAENGRLLRFYVPVDMTPGTFPVTVENARGASNTVQLEVRPPVPLQIIRVAGINPQESRELRFHPGQKFWIIGSGFLPENTVWFGTLSLDVTLPRGYNVLHLVIPPTLAPGDYEVCVSNRAGRSNVVPVHIE
ncbi:MAG TPA: hypothetical protein VMH81_03025 [Bryobacteraceae bacterium]|nr:hypothetical protein [Bryobacteraceae bacterium]